MMRKSSNVIAIGGERMSKRQYSLETLKKMLARAETRYYEETIKPCVPRGYHQPSMKAWLKARERVEDLKRQISEREAERNV